MLCAVSRSRWIWHDIESSQSFSKRYGHNLQQLGRLPLDQPSVRATVLYTKLSLFMIRLVWFINNLPGSLLSSFRNPLNYFLTTGYISGRVCVTLSLLTGHFGSFKIQQQQQQHPNLVNARRTEREWQMCKFLSFSTILISSIINVDMDWCFVCWAELDRAGEWWQLREHSQPVVGVDSWMAKGLADRKAPPWEMARVEMTFGSWEPFSDGPSTLGDIPQHPNSDQIVEIELAFWLVPGQDDSRRPPTSLILVPRPILITKDVAQK